MASNNYGNKLFDAMSIVAESKVKSYHYDETIEATIKDASQAKEGKYKVEYTGGIFEAYGTGGTYYEKEVVYVTVPKGDFTKQKFIIGRKIDEDNAPGTTFNFRMPFDDFIALRNLTNLVDPVRTKNGGAQYIANHPNHGTEVESSSVYAQALSAAQTALSTVTANWANQMTCYQTNCDKLIEEFNNVNYKTETVEVITQTYDSAGRVVNHIEHKEERNQKSIETGESMGSGAYTYNGKTYRQAILDEIDAYVNINGNWKTSTTAYTTLWARIKNILLHYLQNVICKDTTEYPTRTYDALVEFFAWDDTDLNIFLTEIESNYGMGHASQEASYLQQYSNTATSQYAYIDNLARDDGNINLLWSWSDTSGSVLMETKLGVSIDVQTFLGEYHPTDGYYGIRMVITGTTKPTEDEMSREVTETIYFTNESMYGNTYGYYSPYTQQKIFDLSNFLTLTHIDIYFWQDHDKHKFRDYNGNVIPYQRQVALDSNGNFTYDDMPPNIVVANLQVLLGLTAEEATHDRVVLYTYSDKNYGLAQSDLDNPTAVQWARDNAIKELRMAWIHIDPSSGSPVLIDHEKQLNDYDINALEYWHAKIYWYNYQFGHALDKALEAEKFGGVNWKPKPFDQEDQCEEFVYKDDNSNFICNVTPSIEKSKEKYKVSVIAGNTPYHSDIIEFINLDTTIQDNSFDALYDVVFRFMKGVPSSDGTQMTIVQDDSLGNFFVYDENNNVIVNDDGVQYSQIPYYVQIWVRNNESGDYSPASLDPENGISEINWIPFGNNSMITSFTEPTESEMENSELTPIKGSLTDAQKRLIKSITRKFYISRRWVMRYSDNIIRATVRRRNKLYSLQKELLFGQSGTMGSPYTIVIQQTEPENGEMVVGGKFTLTARVFERGKEVPNSKYKFTWKLLSPTYITAAANTAIDGAIPNNDKLDYQGTITNQQWGSWWKSSWNTTNAGGYQNNQISGYIRNNDPMIMKVEVENCADYTISTTTGFALVNTPKINNKSVLFANNFITQCPDRVEYKSDGSAPITDLMEFSVQKKRVTQQNQTAADCGHLYQDKYSDEDDDQYPQELYPTWELYCYQVQDTQYDIQTDPTTGNQITTGIRNITYVGQPNPTSNGASLLACLSLKKVKVPKVTIVGQSDIADTEIPEHWSYSLNSANNYASANSYGPNGPADWYWEDAYEKDYYVVLQWKQTVTVTNIVNNRPIEESATFWFRQAIPLVQNVYSSSLVNNWNGQLLIDEANNAILSKMMAAGSKNKFNQFTGVMMGDWADYGDSSLDIPGMYGFANGKQVFGLRTNGTGFIGKAGRGQIQFDGNYSLISNVDKTCYINLDPINYQQLQDGIRLKTNHRSYSQFFLYAESESTTRTDGSNTADFKWANKILATTNKDIFAVDPNNGVITTGGIFAKYGRIGKYLLLNDAGITYKQHYNPNTGIVDTINDNLTSSENIDIIYIGQERHRDGSLIPLAGAESSRAYDHYYWSSSSYGAGGSTLSGYEQSEGHSGAGSSISDDGAKLGRYVIWAGQKQGRGAYPKFGVEHDGTVHLSDAFVQGVIHASTLIIGNEDYAEATRTHGGPKTFYTKVKQNSDLRGSNPALLKDEPTESGRKFLYGKNGTCHSRYGDWLRPGDTWYISSSKLQRVTVFVGQGTIDEPMYENPFNLTMTLQELKKYSIGFKNGSNFQYITTNGVKQIKYTGTVNYKRFYMGSDGKEKNEDQTLSQLNITELEVTLKNLDTQVRNHKYNNKTVSEYKSIYNTKHEAYLAVLKTASSPTATAVTRAKAASDTALANLNAARADLQALRCTQKTELSKYDAVFGGLESWALTTNSTNNTPLDKTNYDATVLLMEKLDNQEVVEADDGTIEIPNPNALSTEQETLVNQNVGTQMSYTQLVWVGKQEDEETNNHDWFGLWTEDNVLPTNTSPRATQESRVYESQLNGATSTPLELEVTTDEEYQKAGTPGFVHPQLITKKMDDKYHILHRFSAPPGWRLVGDIDSGSIWDALSHATLTFNHSLRATTALLATNLNDTVAQLTAKLNGDQQAAIEQIEQQRRELVTMLTNVQKQILNTVSQSAADIRSGMDPITFFDDGNCYVFISKQPMDSNISGIGVVPAGITVAQTKEQATDKVASIFYLNAKRMGFYRTFEATLGSTPITVNVPLLSYYNGSLGLAGSMFFGLDYNNYIEGTGLTASILNPDGSIKDTTMIDNNPDSFGAQNGRITLYKNYIDGPNCRIVLGNGAIVLDGLDNGKDIDGKSGNYPFENALKVGKQEGGTPFIYVGRNSGAKGVIRIGRHGGGQGNLSIADFDIASCAYSTTLSLYKITSSEGSENAPKEYSVSEMTSLGDIDPTSGSSGNKTFNIVSDITSSGSNPVQYTTQTESLTLEITKLKKKKDVTHAKLTSKTYSGDVSFTTQTIETDSCAIEGDILAITQRCGTADSFTGIGIIGNDATAKSDSRVILGPILVKKLPTSTTATNIVDTTGYSDNLASNAWLTGWNFYGHKIYTRQLFTYGQIVSRGNIYVKAAGKNYYIQLADQKWVIDKIQENINAVYTRVNNNLTTISDGFDDIITVLNKHSDDFKTVSDGLVSLSSGIQTLSGGITTAMQKAAAALSLAQQAIKDANEALAKAVEALKKTVVDGWMLGGTYTSNTIPGTVNLTLTMLLDPTWTGTYLSSDRPKLSYTVESLAADYLHRHGIVISGTAVDKCTFAIGRVRGNDLSIEGSASAPGVANIEISGGLDWVADNYDGSRLSCLQSTLKLGSKEIVLGKVSTYAKFIQLEDWPSFVVEWSSPSVNLGGGKGSGTRKVQFELKSKNTKKNTTGSGPQINLWTALDAWTYSKEVIDDKVQTAFKKGWNDGWVADYIDAYKGTSDTTWKVTLKRPEHECQDGTTIAEKTGNTSKSNVSFKMEYSSSNKTTTISRTTTYTYGGSDNNPLATDNGTAWKAGVTDAMTNAEIKSWWVNKTKGFGAQMTYSYDDPSITKNTDVIYSYLIPNVNIGSYNSSYHSYTITPQVVGYFNGYSSEQTVSFTAETLYATDAYDHGYDEGYVQGWKDARDSMYADVTHPSNNYSGSVYGYAKIDAHTYYKKRGGSVGIASRSTYDSAYLSFSKGSVSVDAFYSGHDGALDYVYKSDGYSAGSGYNYVCAWGSLGSISWS